MNERAHWVLAGMLLLVIGASGGCAGLSRQAGGSAGAGPEHWGTIDGKPVRHYTLRNDAGATLGVTNYGAIITSLHVPDRDGALADVVLGYDSLDGYIASTPYFGAIVGRNANRIVKGRFELEGRSYQLALNIGSNHLHGGWKGFDKQVWNARPLNTADGPAIELTYVSPNGEEAYPGTLRATVRYTLTHDNRLLVDMTAKADQTTLCDLAQHTYWNLAGHGSGTIEVHRLKLNARQYTPADANLIPTGELASVSGTPFDFTQGKPIGRDLRQIDADPVGYDHNFVLIGEPFAMKMVADVIEPVSGRRMIIRANQPGVQFYSGNFLDGTLIGKGGARYEQYQGFCLETQVYPDAIHQPDWPQAILRPGETYRHQMEIAFSVVPGDAQPAN